jgi:hypothetical protein
MTASALSGQTMSLVLAAAGVAFLFICLLLILFNRVPTLKSPEVIRAFGVELNVSIITILVLVGFVMALSSTYIQVRDYEKQLSDSRTQLDERDKQLRRAGKMTLTPLVVLTDVSKQNPMPKISEVFCTYTLVDGGNVVPGNSCVVSAGIAEASFQITLEDIPTSAEIRLVEIKEKDPKNPRTWVTKKPVGYPLSPTLEVEGATK